MESTKMPRLLLAGLMALALPALAQAAAPPAGDPAKGEATFKKICSVCHTVVEDTAVHPGPLLKGVVGRKAGSLPTFKYSAALKASGLTWDKTNLDKFLTLPSALVPGTFMVITLPTPADRADMIAYLTKIGAPAPAAKSK